MKSFLLIFLITFFLKSPCFTQSIHEPYRSIYQAEFHILNSKLDSAILHYNQAYKIAPLSRTNVEQYIMLLEKDSVLGIRYLDTLLYYLAHYSQHIERYANYKIVENAIKANTHKKFPLKNPKENYNCSELEGLFMDIVRENSKIKRKENIVPGAIDSAGRAFDSMAYFKICNLLQEEKYLPCHNTFFLISTIYNLALDYRIISDNKLLDSILTKSAEAKRIDITSLGRFLDNIYSKNESYKSMFPEIHIFRKDIIYEKLDSNELLVINKRRATYDIEPFQDYLEKIIQQIEKKRTLWRLSFLNHVDYKLDEKEEAYEIYKLLSDTEKKYTAYKLKIKGNSYFYQPAVR